MPSNPLFVLFIVLLSLATLAGAMALITWRQRSRLRARLRRQYGNPPQQLNGLRNARVFWAVYRKAAPAAAHQFDVDDLTWSDLDLDDIYARFNACQSAVGDIRLYAALRRLPLGPQPDPTQQSREALAARFAQSPALCHKARYLLAKLGRFDANDLQTAVFKADALALPHRWLYFILALLPFAAIPLFWVNAALAGFLLFGAIFTNYVVYTVVRGKTEGGFRAVRYLASSLNTARKMAGLLHSAAPQEAAALKAHAARFARFRPGILLLTFNNMLEEAIDFDPSGFFLLPLLAYGTVVKQLAGSGPQTLALYTLLGEVDLAQGLASTRESLALWCRPAFTAEGVLEAKNIFHPMLDEPVANSGRFENDLLLTGSNASGKSTFIKALAIGCITAQGLLTCTAQALTLKRGAVATSMAVADSVVDGDSYFVAEIKSMRRLLRVARRGQAAPAGEGAGGDGAEEAFSYLFIDEILKGTNTVERVAASAAVLHHLHAAPCLCVAATHDIELTAMLAGEYDNYHFRETVTEDGVVFDYALRAGPSATRNAILLLERMDYPGSLVEQARSLAARFERAGVWGRPDEAGEG